MTVCEGICSWGEITQNVYNLAQFLKLRFTYTTSFHNASDGTVTTAHKWLVSKQTISFYDGNHILLQAIYLQLGQVISLKVRPNCDFVTIFLHNT